MHSKSIDTYSTLYCSFYCYEDLENVYVIVNARIETAVQTKVL